MNSKTRGNTWQNSPPPHESTSPPARSIASHKGSADRTRSSAVAASTSSTAQTAVTISRRVSAGRSASESLSTVEHYAGPAGSRPGASAGDPPRLPSAIVRPWLTMRSTRCCSLMLTARCCPLAGARSSRPRSLGGYRTWRGCAWTPGHAWLGCRAPWCGPRHGWRTRTPR